MSILGGKLPDLPRGNKASYRRLHRILLDQHFDVNNRPTRYNVALKQRWNSLSPEQKRELGSIFTLAKNLRGLWNGFNFDGKIPPINPNYVAIPPYNENYVQLQQEFQELLQDNAKRGEIINRLLNLLSKRENPPLEESEPPLRGSDQREQIFEEESPELFQGNQNEIFEEEAPELFQGDQREPPRRGSEQSEPQTGYEQSEVKEEEKLPEEEEEEEEEENPFDIVNRIDKLVKNRADYLQSLPFGPREAFANRIKAQEREYENSVQQGIQLNQRAQQIENKRLHGYFISPLEEKELLEFEKRKALIQKEKKKKHRAFEEERTAFERDYYGRR